MVWWVKASGHGGEEPGGKRFELHILKSPFGFELQATIPKQQLDEQRGEKLYWQRVNFFARRLKCRLNCFECFVTFSENYATGPSFFPLCLVKVLLTPMGFWYIRQHALILSSFLYSLTHFHTHLHYAFHLHCTSITHHLKHTKDQSSVLLYYPIVLFHCIVPHTSTST